MKFTILDVGHGFCAYLVADNNNLMVFDCGHKTDPEIRPSYHLYHEGQRSIERLFITNFDEDHISDLPNIQKYVKARILHKNPSISVDELRRLKLQSGPITPAMETLLEMMEEYSGGVSNPPDFPRVEWKSFWNKYSSDFDDTNNISLVTFLDLGDATVLIPGDLEKPGWENLLGLSEFRERLRSVDVFIAPHHGRKNGYCADVFQYCTPQVVVMSDGPIVHATQEMVNTYANHATGINYGVRTRYVLTTRNDGTISWEL